MVGHQHIGVIRKTIFAGSLAKPRQVLLPVLGCEKMACLLLPRWITRRGWFFSRYRFPRATSFAHPFPNGYPGPCPIATLIPIPLLTLAPQGRRFLLLCKLILAFAG
jgi:hypothetical protein